ncbi:glutaconate CoA-transferase subunit A [Peptoniphilus catoniae]|uniref:glutaconate CoA-transferase subunit A n=1 Tax=Peptoniphilus catoniae TaxID=1660341 RepID=UPI0010FCF939|nr:glutaconate CoA-transferase subunit A [Peptoniphilus catoniae]
MSKIYSLKDAISKFVEDGDVMSFGGFTTNRKPYAAVYEILRQGKKDFIAEAGPAGGDWDMLIGEDRVLAYINCYTANSGYTNVSRRFRKHIEEGKILFEDYSQDVEMLRLHAASLGLPYLPVKLMMGTGLTEEWGISREEREKIDKLPNEKFVEVENPFKKGDKVIACPVPVIDTAIIHVQVASPDGTCRIIGDEFHDVDIAVAARKTIVTCEELVSNEEIRREPTKNSIPAFCVDAVVHAPYGAHPSQCYDYYDYDADFFKMYNVVSKGDEDFKKFVKEWVYDVEDHEAYLNKLGATRLIDLKPVPGFGYATNVLKEGK